MSFTRRHVLSLAAGTGAALAAPGLVSAQGAWPQRPLRVIVAYPPGGPSDGLSRMIAQALSERLGQPVVVDNRGGGNATIGTEAAARAAPDGYTITMGTQQNHATNQFLIPNLTHDGIRDFEPITLVSTSAHVLVVHPSVEARTAQDFVALVRARPGGLNYASPGSGSASHLAMELFRTRVGNLDMTHVSYRGAAPMITDLVAGHVQASMATVTSSLGQIRSGNLRALGLASNARVAPLPDVATFQEQGLPAVEADAWFAWFAPRGTPQPIVERLDREIAEIVAIPENRARIEQMGMVPRTMRRAEFAPFLLEEGRKWAEVVRVSGARVE